MHYCFVTTILVINPPENASKLSKDSPKIVANIQEIYRTQCPTILNQGFTAALVNLETSMKASSKEGTMNGTLHSLRMSPSTSSYSSLFCRSVSISTSRALSRIRLAGNHGCKGVKICNKWHEPKPSAEESSAGISVAPASFKFSLISACLAARLATSRLRCSNSCINRVTSCSR